MTDHYRDRNLSRSRKSLRSTKIHTLCSQHILKCRKRPLLKHLTINQNSKCHLTHCPRKSPYLKRCKTFHHPSRKIAKPMPCMVVLNLRYTTDPGHEILSRF